MTRLTDCQKALRPEFKLCPRIIVPGAAVRFDLAVSTVIKWMRRVRETGNARLGRCEETRAK
jgi:hypothetical protein